MVKERDVIRHLNDLFQKAHRRTAIKKIVDGYVAEMFFDLNIHLISIGQVYGRFDKSLGLLFTLRQGEVRDTALNLFHDFLKRRSMTAIGEVCQLWLDFLYWFFAKLFLINYLSHLFFLPN